MVDFSRLSPTPFSTVTPIKQQALFPGNEALEPTPQALANVQNLHFNDKRGEINRKLDSFRLWINQNLSGIERANGVTTEIDRFLGNTAPTREDLLGILNSIRTLMNLRQPPPRPPLGY